MLGSDPAPIESLAAQLCQRSRNSLVYAGQKSFDFGQQSVIDQSFQHVQRHGAILEHGIVKLAKIKFIAEFVVNAGAEVL